MRRSFAVVYENGPNNLSAYVPDLPGCVSVGDTIEEIRDMMREAMTFHIEIMLEHGQSVPEASTSVQQALDLHNRDLSEDYRAVGEPVPEAPAIAELVYIDAAPEAIRQEYGHLIPEIVLTVPDKSLRQVSSV